MTHIPIEIRCDNEMIRDQMLDDVDGEYEIWARQDLGRHFIEIYRGPQGEFLAFIMALNKGEDMLECGGTGGVTPLVGNSIEFHRGLSDAWSRMSKLLNGPASVG